MQPDPRAWRPQAFGRRKPRDLRDPARRAGVGRHPRPRPRQAGGRQPRRRGRHGPGSRPPRDRCRARDVRAGGVTRRGRLPDGPGAALRRGGRPRRSTEGPGMGEHVTQFFLGSRPPTPWAAAGASPAGRPSGRSARPRPAAAAEPGPIAFVAVDLLALDDEPLLEIPLLERKRLLESVLPEGRARPPHTLRPRAGRQLHHHLALARLRRPRLQGGQQPLPPGRPERRLVAHGDAAPLRRSPGCRAGRPRRPGRFPRRPW